MSESKSELKRLCTLDHVGMAHKMWELEQENAELNAKWVASEARLSTCIISREDYKERAEKAERIIAERQTQKPVGIVRMTEPPDGNPKPIPKWIMTADQSHLKDGDLLFASPVIQEGMVKESDVLQKVIDAWYSPYQQNGVPFIARLEAMLNASKE